MSIPSSDDATVQALRNDVALQLARHARRMGLSQVIAARKFGLPQPTLSKIINGRVSDISLELLIRAAVRAGLPMTLQTGQAPQESGAFISLAHSLSTRMFPSKLAEVARQSMIQSEESLTPTQRLEAFLEHNRSLGAVHQAGRAAEAQHISKPLVEA
jgi:predicted XRE-type DNA-binding protein